jgi:type II secretory pathway component GspD/PulD (secretin)
MFTFAADEFIAAPNALATEKKVNLLSNSSIMTSENKKTVIEGNDVGEAEPYRSTRRASRSAKRRPPWSC